MNPDIQSFIATLRREETGRVPVAELGVHPDIKGEIVGRPIVTLADDVAFWHTAGYDYVKLQPGADFNPGGIGGPARVTYNPDGTVFRKWASEGRGVIGSRKEMAAYRFPDGSDFDYRRFEEVGLLLPDGMGVIGQYGDIFTMTWEMMGFEAFSMALYEDPGLVRNLNERLGELVVGMFERMASLDTVNVLWYSDDIAYASGLMVSPSVLDSLFFPWLRRIGGIARESGKPLIYHSDGVLWEVMEKIIECGVDALHPIEPKAMQLAEVKQRYGDRLCLIGHVDVDLLARGTEEEVRSQVRKNVQETGGGYCVGSGNSIPEYVLLQNYIAMLDEAGRYGRDA